MASPESQPSGRPRLGYLLPQYHQASSEHYAHIPHLLELLGERVDLEVAIWDCQGEPRLPGVERVHRLTAAHKVRRWLTLVKLIRSRVKAGCRRWFVRGSALLALAAEVAGAETVYWMCGVHRPPSGWRDRLVRALLARIIRRAHRIATAPGLQAYNERELGVPRGKTLLLDNDIDLTRYRPLTAEERIAVRQAHQIPDDCVWLLYVHRLTANRGAHWLIPVIEGCVAAGQRVCCLAVGGDGDQSEPLRAYAAQHPDRLRLAGVLPNAALPPLYAAADLFLLPSQGEGFPRVLLEAMACGTAVVSTDCGVVSTILPAALHGTAMASVGDPGTFVQRVVDLVSDPAAREALAAQVLVRAAYYDTARVAGQYAEVLCGLPADAP